MGLLSRFFGADNEPERVDDRVTAEARTRWSYPGSDGREGASLVETVRSEWRASDPQIDRPDWARDWDRESR